MPAVSIRTTGTPSKLNSVSTGSRVVPGVGLTRARSSPNRALSSDDLPTFRRPLLRRRQLFDHAVEQVTHADAVLRRDEVGLVEAQLEQLVCKVALGG